MRSLQTFTQCLLLCCSVFSVKIQANYVETGWQFSVATGYGALENPLKAAHDVHTYVLPHVSYYGERFYLENFNTGFSVLESPDLIIDIDGKLNDDGLLFELNGLQHLLATDLFIYKPYQIPFNGPTNFQDIQRSPSYLAGVRITFPTEYGELSLGQYHDISAVHNGSESQIKYQHEGRILQFKWGFEFGMTYKNAALVDYYYRLSKAELGTYKNNQVTRGTQNYHTRLVFNAPITEQWFYVASVEHHWLGRGIANSLLIRKNNYSTYFFGVGYAF